MQVIASVNVDELVTVDVDASREGKAPHRLQQHGEMCVGQIAGASPHRVALFWRPGV